jgi:hypothetical protein
LDKRVVKQEIVYFLKRQIVRGVKEVKIGKEGPNLSNLFNYFNQTNLLSNSQCFITKGKNITRINKITMGTNRRDFIKNTSALATGLGFSSLVLGNKGIDSGPAIARVNLGVIGLGMGCRDLQGALTGNPWVHCIAMCDVNRQRLDEQAARFKKDFPEQTTNMQLYGDFRKLLENKDINGVIIATPIIGIPIFLPKH